jgi:hypothetical protein
MKMSVFWVVVWWKFNDVSEVLAASIIRAMKATNTFETSVNFH